jgi:thymidylate synthase (FAD)
MNITFCREPKVYMVGHSIIKTENLNLFLADIDANPWLSTVQAVEPSSILDRIPEVAGRVCYMSFAPMLEGEGRGTNSKYLEHILEVGHESVLEHSSINMIITGISRTLTHELVRHRVGMSYSQLSQRYVDPSKEISCVIPPEFLNSPIEEAWKARIIEEYAQYSMLYEKTKVELDICGISKKEKRMRALQATRSLLPNATETKIFVTFNLRSLRHFFKLRGNKTADLEIRRLATCIYTMVSKLHALQDIKCITDDDGIQSLVFSKKGQSTC